MLQKKVTILPREKHPPPPGRRMWQKLCMRTNQQRRDGAATSPPPTCRVLSKHDRAGERYHISENVEIPVCRVDLRVPFTSAR
jgi:hypothetical protein